MKKLIGFLLSLVVALSVPYSVFAEQTQEVIDLTGFSVELSEADWECGGITIIFKDDGNGGYVQEKVSDQEAQALIAREEVEAYFHVGITYTKRTSAAHLHWSAGGEQLTKVQAKVYCKNTDILGPYYYNKSIKAYNDLEGRYNIANGNCATFKIPEDVNKVNVGFTEASITRVKYGKLSWPNGMETVTLK